MVVVDSDGHDVGGGGCAGDDRMERAWLLESIALHLNPSSNTYYFYHKMIVVNLSEP